MYFLRGDLPWQGMKGKTKQEKYHKIMEKKIQATPDSLCKGYPGMLIFIQRKFRFISNIVEVFNSKRNQTTTT